MSSPHPSDDLLIAFAVGDLSPDARDDVASHRQDCSLCDQTITTLTRSLDAFRDVPLPDAPAPILVRLLESQTGARRDIFRMLRPAAAGLIAAALLGAVFVGGFWAGRHATPSADAPQGPLTRPLPEPPAVTFHAAVAGT